MHNLYTAIQGSATAACLTGPETDIQCENVPKVYATYQKALPLAQFGVSLESPLWQVYVEQLPHFRKGCTVQTTDDLTQDDILAACRNLPAPLPPPQTHRPLSESISWLSAILSTICTVSLLCSA